MLGRCINFAPHQQYCVEHAR